MAHLLSPASQARTASKPTTYCATLNLRCTYNNITQPRTQIAYFTAYTDESAQDEAHTWAKTFINPNNSMLTLTLKRVNDKSIVDSCNNFPVN